MSAQVDIFSGRASQYLGNKIADAYGVELGEFKTYTFSY